MIRLPGTLGAIAAFDMAPQARPPNPGQAAANAAGQTTTGQNQATTAQTHDAATAGAPAATTDDGVAGRVVVAVGLMVGLGWLATKALAPR